MTDAKETQRMFSCKNAKGTRTSVTVRSMRAILAGLLFAAVPWHAGAQPKPAVQRGVEILCPPTINVEQRATTVPEGWEAGRSAAATRLATVTFFDGPPDERVSLKHDREEKQKREWVGIWTLPPSARGYWIACGYDNTTAVLSRQLPAGVATCTVTYERKGQVTAGLPAIKRIECK